MGINDMAKSSGRVLKEDGSYINQAEMFEALYNALLAGTLNVTLMGSILAEGHMTESDAVANVITFTENITAIEIIHEEETRQTFTINGLPVITRAGGYRTPVGGVPGKTVTIPVGISCEVGRLV